MGILLAMWSLRELHAIVALDLLALLNEVEFLGGRARLGMRLGEVNEGDHFELSSVLVIKDAVGIEDQVVDFEAI